VSLVHAASIPFFDWFFGGAEASRAAFTEWIARPSSEVSGSRMSILYATGKRPVGLFVGLSGAELALCRKADLLAAMSQVPTTEARRALADRVARTADLFAPVGADEYYLSKIAVAPRRRGSGLGWLLLDEFLTQGETQGFDRFSLDVAADNPRAVHVYRSAGFQKAHTRQRAGLRYVRMVLDRRGMNG
jgi:ribosomal protein S18 acetylase RimI-like enzyme